MKHKSKKIIHWTIILAIVLFVLVVSILNTSCTKAPAKGEDIVCIHCEFIKPPPVPPPPNLVYDTNILDICNTYAIITALKMDLEAWGWECKEVLK